MHFVNWGFGTGHIVEVIKMAACSRGVCANSGLINFVSKVKFELLSLSKKVDSKEALDFCSWQTCICRYSEYRMLALLRHVIWSPGNAVLPLWKVDPYSPSV